MVRRILPILVIAFVASMIPARESSACPLCAAASESNKDSKNPGSGNAINTSILFMLSMPYLMTGVFGGAFYLMYRRARLSEARLEKDSPSGHMNAGNSEV